MDLERIDGEARPFLLFSKPSSRRTDSQPQVQPQPKPPKPDPTPAVQSDNGGSGDPGSDSEADPAPNVVTEHGDSCNADGEAPASFADLGLSEWLVDVCSSLGMRRPTAVQRRCIPRALAGENVLGIAETGSGKTAAFALPILHRLGEDPFGVAALALSPTQELAAQLAEQFRALGSPLGIRCLAAIGGFNSLGQAKGLARRPHVVVATPGRIATLIKNDPDLAKVFARTKFLVLDEADRVVDSNFEEDLKVIFDCLPKKRQTFLFSATMSENLRSLLELSGSKSYFYEAYEGFKTVEGLKQQYIDIPPDGKELHLLYLVSKMKEDNIRSAIVFVSTCRTCQYLDFVLQELGQPAVSLHSHKAQSLRLSALHRFKSGQVPVLIATDVASRGLDIQTVDLVINYDIPRFPRDYIQGLRVDLSQLVAGVPTSRQVARQVVTYRNLSQLVEVLNLSLGYRQVDKSCDLSRLVERHLILDYIHRVGRTARATRGGLSISFVTQRDICLLHEIEDDVGKRLDAYECDDKEVTKDITKVFKARRLANMRMADEGHEDKVQDRKDQKKRDEARKRKHEE